MNKKMMITAEIKRTQKKRRYQEGKYEDFCDGNNDETSDNIDKMNKKKHHLKKGISNYLK